MCKNLRVLLFLRKHCKNRCESRIADFCPNCNVPKLEFWHIAAPNWMHPSRRHTRHRPTTSSSNNTNGNGNGNNSRSKNKNNDNRSCGPALGLGFGIVGRVCRGPAPRLNQVFGEFRFRPNKDPQTGALHNGCKALKPYKPGNPKP